MGDIRRLYFLDNLRIGLTVLVIAHHVGQAYGPTGGYWPVQEATRAAVLGPFFTVNRSFFMSLFFLISGYLMVASYDRAGPAAFFRSRFLRLGVPLLAFFLLVIPVQQYLCHRLADDVGDMGFWSYYAGCYFGGVEKPADWRGPAWPEMNFGHLWYVEHLLIFSLFYAVVRLLWRRPIDATPAKPRPPSHRAIVLFALALAVVSGVVRIWYPIDRWIGFLGFIQVAFADVPRDLSFFLLGILAYRRQWFLGMPTRMGLVWLAVGLGASVVWYVFSLGHLWRVFHITRESMVFIYPVWEALLCCGMCIGLIVLFREALNVQGRWGRTMAANQYAAYLFHVPVVILVQLAVAGAVLSPFTKFVLVTAVGVPLTFLLSAAVRMPAFVRRVL